AWRKQEGRWIAGCETEQGEGEREHAPVQRDHPHERAHESRERGTHSVISHRWVNASTAVMVSVPLVVQLACIAPQRPADVMVLASGADLESANPLVTTHPLSRQVQRYALFVTLLRYDSTLALQPY